MTDDQMQAAEAAHQAELKSTAPATRGFVTRSVDALAGAVAQALRDELGKVRRANESTAGLLADLDERLASVEARLKELQR